ncbi:hypothetical protein [Ottowia sp. VDI28]|uniref:hypothetical protein n=1 Tax=Ottowia sp. VDI28 TaxID=3133968 RepID=UPI003C300EFC
MKHALSTLNPTSLAEARPIPRKLIAEVFDRLQAQLGGKMADLYAGADLRLVQDEWGAGLAGFQPKEIERGVAMCRERAFAPTLGEFLRMCRPAVDPEYAWLEAGDCLRQRDAGLVGDWSHPAVWRAASKMGPEVRSGDWRAHRTRWTYNLRRELAAGWGEAPPRPLPAITHNATTRGPTPAERAAMASLSIRARHQEGAQ